jgi:CubicO group peptidase (beta-lactamase class C family)
VLVAKEGELLLQKGFGFADREWKEPNTPRTQFRLASTSKLLTRVALFLEAEKGALSVDDPLSKFLPDYPNGDRVSLSNLLNHTSGIPDFYNHPQYSDGIDFTTPITIVELMDRLKEFPLAFDPGTQIRYSNSGYVLLSQVVETTSGIPFSEYLKDRVFSPIGMEDSGHLGFDEPAHPATGYVLDSDTLVRAGEEDPTYYLGSGGVFASVGDLFSFYQALYEDGFLSEPSMRGFTPGRHFGSLWGFRSAFEPVPTRGTVVILLSNLWHAPVEEISSEIMTILFEGDVIEQRADALTEYAGRFRGPDFDRIGAEIRVFIEGDGLRLRLSQVPGETMEMSLLPESRDRFLTMRDGQFTGIIVDFERDDEGEVQGLVFDAYGWSVTFDLLGGVG